MTINGKWRLAIETPMGTQTPILELHQDGDAISGTISGEEGSGPIGDPKRNRRTVTWTTPIRKPMPMTLSFTAEILDENTLTGEPLP